MLERREIILWEGGLFRKRVFFFFFFTWLSFHR